MDFSTNEPSTRVSVALSVGNGSSIAEVLRVRRCRPRPDFHGRSRLLLRPGVLERDRPIEHWAARLAVLAIRREVPKPLELEPFSRLGVAERTLELRGHGFERAWIYEFP